MKILLKYLILSVVAFFLFGCAADMFAVYGRFVGNKKYDNAISSLTTYLKRHEGSLKPYEKAAYLLLEGIAYQKKLEFSKSMEYYDASLNAGYKFNYFALLQKAEVYRIENKHDDEIKYLKLAVENIRLLSLEVRADSLSEDEISWNKKEEFVLSYYINKEGIKVAKEDYIEYLQNKILKIENLIKTCQ